MKTQEFKTIRKKLQKTQEAMARLLGISVKAVRSYEQGWRAIPVHAERQILFLTAKKNEIHTPVKPCWQITRCSDEQKEKCPAWEFQTGTLCWFINGTICSGVVHKDWREKIKICKKCKAFPSSLKSILSSEPNKPGSITDNDCFSTSE